MTDNLLNLRLNAVRLNTHQIRFGFFQEHLV